MAIIGTNAQPPEREPKRPSLSVETRDNFKNVQTIDSDLPKQARDLLLLRQVPSDQNATVLPGLIANSTGLPPPFLLEIARRLWEMSRQEDAFEWYALTLVRARYDAGKCVDPTAQHILMPPIAANVAGGVSPSA